VRRTFGQAKAGADLGTEHGGRAVQTVQAGVSQGGQHALAAELLLFVGIVAVRAIATYGPAPVVKGKTQTKHLPSDQFGPLFVLGNGFVLFFILALLSARGGATAKVAAAAGLIVDVALLLKSIPHIQQLALVYDSPRQYTPDTLTAFTASEAAVPPLSVPQVQSLSKPGGKLSGPSVAPGSSAAAAMAYAHSRLTAFHLSPSQWPGLVWLWNKESGWRSTAVNPSSGATGIPQLNPNAHQVPADWSNYKVQIDWGLAYIEHTYGSIDAAVASERHRGWY